MTLANHTHATLTGTVLGALLSQVDSPITGITDVRPEMSSAGGYRNTIDVVANGLSFQVIVVAEPLEICALP